jgi:L-ribulokinase
MLIAPAREIGDKLVRGICGQVDGSIVPGMIGLEAGQSAFGDVYAWFKNMLMWPVDNLLDVSTEVSVTALKNLKRTAGEMMIAGLSRAASKLPMGETEIAALDWLNGRRTPDANQRLTGAIAGLNLGSDAPRVFRALVEATAFGAKAIVDRFVAEGIRIEQVIALGGIAKKSPFVMQVVADVLEMPIKVAAAEEACALGSAMCAAVAAGVYPTVEAAQKAMGSGFEREYAPNVANAQKARQLYAKYQALGKFVESKTA